MAPYSSFVKMGGNDERSIPSTTFERIIPTVTSYLSASSFKDLGQVEKNAVMVDISGVTTAIADNAARSDYRVTSITPTCRYVRPPAGVYMNLDLAIRRSTHL